MHKGLRRLLAAGSAVVMSMLTLAAPVAADDAALPDFNGDGVVDVFDYVMSKRVTVAENAPMDLSLSSVEGCAGDVVTVNAVIDNNPGFSFVRVAVQYADGLVPYIPEGFDEPIRANTEQFPDMNLSVTMLKKYNMIVCCSDSAKETEGEGALFSVSFRIPEDAAPGTSYPVSFQDIVFTDSGAKLPLLTERGKVTVLPPGSPKPPEPPVTAPPQTTAAAPVTTAAPAAGTTTTASAAQTVTAAVTTAGTTAPQTRTVQTAAATTAPATAAPKATAAKTTAAVRTTAAQTTTVKTTKPFVVTATTVTTIVTTTVRPYLFHGIDISFWQGDSVNFETVKTDPKAQYVILRAGFGKYLKQTDPTFYANYDRAKAAGIPVGAYWYSYAKTPEEARIEANVCAQVLGNRTFDYPIAFDIEEKDVLALDTATISSIVDAFCSEMEKKGYFSQIYCSSSYLTHKMTQAVKSRYDVWVAHYNVIAPTYTGAYGMWQYGTGKVAGFKDPVDVDYCYRDYPSAIKRAKLNGYQ